MPKESEKQAKAREVVDILQEISILLVRTQTSPFPSPLTPLPSPGPYLTISDLTESFN